VHHDVTVVGLKQRREHGRCGFRLRPGLTIAIEPWFAASTATVVTDADGWTIRSADGSRCAHSEHTIAVTAEGPSILTLRD